MPAIDFKRVLWENVSALMQKHFGRENLTRLARETKCGPGTATRIKERETSVGIDVLEKIASAFNLQPWQLLVPGFDPSHPPTLKPVTAEERALYERLLADAQQLAKLNR
jgi:transcriptional regulator with XRE-family HTH domain